MRKYFLGGNTPKGFYSYYDYLIRQQEARKIYIIKGGPGTGKSTLMKKIGAWAEDSGYDTDYIYCSSDPNSLDGVVVPEMKIAMVDGTAPHIVDPKNPGAVDTIIHMGDLWNEKNMRRNKADILAINEKISEKFALAYEHLKAAGVLHDTIRKLQLRILKKEAVMKNADEIIYSEIKDFSETGTGFQRKLFASAFGPAGYVSHANTLSCSKKYVLHGSGAGLVTGKLARVFKDYDYDTELFYSPLCPENEILHIYVPELDLGIFTEEPEGGIKGENATVLDLSHLGDRYILDEYAEELDSCRQALNIQIDRACTVIKSAKILHDKLESCYIPNMDFARAGKIEEKIIAELEEMK